MNFGDLQRFAFVATVLHFFEEVGEVELMNGNEVAQVECVFVDVQGAGSSEVYDGVTVNYVQDFTDAVKLGGRPVIDQVADLNHILCPQMIGVNDRKPLYSIWEFFIFHDRQR